MEVYDQLRIIRKPEALKYMGLSSSTFHNYINQGLIVTPISLGARSSGYPLHEIKRINAARIAGKSDDDIRLIVQELIEKRNAIFQ